MTYVKLAAVLMGVALLGGCADGNDQILSSVPAAANDDTLTAETERSDPMDPNDGIDDAIGTDM